MLSQAVEADAKTAANILRFVIAGSGYTGVEIATNLAEMIEVIRKKYPGLQKIKPTIILINSRKEILPGLQPGMKSIRSYTEKILQQYGIKILHQTKITRVTAQGAYLSDGSFIESRMVISTIGQTRININGTQNMERDCEKRILTNSFLQVKNQEAIWGAGDAVHVTHTISKNACPSNALWAIKQGEHAGKNIARAILSQPLKSFTYKGLGQCASLGIGKGIGELYGIQFTGWIAWIARWFFFQHFMPLKKIMWHEIADWARLLLTSKRRDLKIMNDGFRRNYSAEWFQPLGPSQLICQN
jgi:NADH dehydrogenase